MAARLEQEKTRLPAKIRTGRTGLFRCHSPYKKARNKRRPAAKRYLAYARVITSDKPTIMAIMARAYNRLPGKSRLPFALTIHSSFVMLRAAISQARAQMKAMK